MCNLYIYASLIEHQMEEPRIMKLVTDIVETDMICDMTLNLNNVRLEELRSLGEHKLADAIEKNQSAQLRE